MNEVKSFKQFLQEKNYFTESELSMLNENLKHELTEDEEIRIDKAIDEFVAEYIDGIKDINDFNTELTNEGVLGTILGGLTGLALGKSVGKLIAKILGVQSGLLYDLLTSRIVAAALGAGLGRKL